MDLVRALLLAALSPIAGGCGATAVADVDPATDAGIADAASDSLLDPGDAADAQSFEECMAALCADDPQSACCCAPTALDLAESPACSFDYPRDVATEWGQFTPDPQRVNVLIVDSHGVETTVPLVTGADDCGANHGFFYVYADGDDIPLAFRLCPASCALAAGTIVVEIGCATIICC